MDDIYREIILENYKKPMNAKKLEGVAEEEVINQSCGDRIDIQIKVKDGKVCDVGHQTSGCAISTASMSILSDHIKGMGVDDVAKIGFDDIQELLGIEIGPGRLKCAMLSLRAVRKSLGMNEKAEDR